MDSADGDGLGLQIAIEGVSKVLVKYYLFIPLLLYGWISVDRSWHRRDLGWSSCWITCWSCMCVSDENTVQLVEHYKPVINYQLLMIDKIFPHFLDGFCVGKADSFVDDAVGSAVGNILGLEEGVLPEKKVGKKRKS